MHFLNLAVKLYIVNLFIINISDAMYNVINQSSDNSSLVIFKIDDSIKLEYTSSSYKQSFDQDSINYCNFDPLALTKKIEFFDQIDREKPDFFVNVFSKTYSFNLTSEIKIRINFMNQQADSNQLWYLLVAKSACTNSVVGSWRLVQSATTDTIFCYNRDDTVFGHRNNRQDTTFDQIWIPGNINEDIYFVVAVFTDETYSAINPTYFLLSSPVFRFDQPEFNNPCPNLISHLGSLDNSPNKTSRPKAKINNTTVTSTTTTTKLPLLSKKPVLTSTTVTTASTSTKLLHSTTKKALTIKAMNQKTEIKNTFVKSKLKMNSSLRVKEDFNKSQSILVSLNGRAKLCSKQLSDNLKEDNLKAKLDEIYNQIENFDRVEIVKIENIRCSSLKLKRNINNQLTFQNNLNFYIQHYILFTTPVHNSIKFTALNELKNFLSNSNFHPDVEFIDGYITNENGSQIRLENSCLLYENLDICQNNGVCVVMPNGLPACSCVYIDETHFWTGDFCTIKSEQSYDPDKIKLIASVTALGGFVIFSLLVLFIVALCKKKCNKKSKKKSIPESSNITYNASSNDTSIISNLNQTSSTSRSNSQLDEHIVNKLAYPREITIFSTPLKTKFKTKPNSKSKDVQKNSNADHLNKSHVNYAYNVSLNDEPFYLEKNKSELKNKNLTNEQKYSANIRRESSQLLPQSMEKHLVKNLQNFSADAVSTICSSSEYNYDNNNHYLKSKEYQSVNDYNLKDEDAWVPILVLAEEQIKKYEAEKIHDLNLTESYMF